MILGNHLRGASHIILILPGILILISFVSLPLHSILHILPLLSSTSYAASSLSAACSHDSLHLIFLLSALIVSFNKDGSWQRISSELPGKALMGWQKFGDMKAVGNSPLQWQVQSVGLGVDHSANLKRSCILVIQTLRRSYCREVVRTYKDLVTNCVCALNSAVLICGISLVSLCSSQALTQ